MVEIWRRKELNVKVYRPEEKIRLKKEQALPFLSYLGLRISEAGGFFMLSAAGFFEGLKGFFSAKNKIREIQRKHEKVIDLSRKNHSE